MDNQQPGPDRSVEAHQIDIQFANLPKVELHLHLEGALDGMTLKEFERQSSAALSSGWCRRCVF
jgi:hypothetical protein